MSNDVIHYVRVFINYINSISKQYKNTVRSYLTLCTFDQIWSKGKSKMKLTLINGILKNFFDVLP